MTKLTIFVSGQRVRNLRDTRTGTVVDMFNDLVVSVAYDDGVDDIPEVALACDLMTSETSAPPRLTAEQIKRGIRAIYPDTDDSLV